MALREKRACRWNFDSLLQVVCKAQALSQRQGTLGAWAELRPECNVDAFSGTPFGWFYPRPASLLDQLNVPLSALLNAGRCEHLWCDLALLLFAGERSGELLEDSSSSAGVSTLLGTMGPFPLLRAVGCLAWLLSCTSFSLRSCLFSTWARRLSFSRCRCSMRSCNSLIFLTCPSCFFSMSWRQ